MATPTETRAATHRLGQGFRAGAWHGDTYVDDQSAKFRHCAIWSEEPASGTSFFFGLDAAYVLRVAVSNPKWSLGANRETEIDVAIDRKYSQRLRALIEEKGYFIPFADSHEAFHALRTGHALRLTLGNRPFEIELTDNRPAFSALLSCVTRAVKREHPMETPKPFADQPLDPHYDDDAVLVAQLLRSAGFDRLNFRMLAVNDTERFLPEADYAWTDGRILGYQANDRHSAAVDPAAYAAKLTQERSSSCKGPFTASAPTISDVAGRPSLRFHLRCDAPKGWAYYCTLYFPGEHRVLSYVHRGPAAAEESLRDADARLAARTAAIFGKKP
jgi:hypothetical protein